MINKADALDIVLNKILTHVEETKCKDDDIHTLTQIALVLEMDPETVKWQHNIERQREIKNKQKEQERQEAMRRLEGLSAPYPYGLDGAPNHFNSGVDYSSDYKY